MPDAPHFNDPEHWRRRSEESRVLAEQMMLSSRFGPNSTVLCGTAAYPSIASVPFGCRLRKQWGPITEVGGRHSITSLARPRSGNGSVMPRALALFVLMISSPMVTCWTGRSLAFSPLRIRPV